MKNLRKVFAGAAAALAFAAASPALAEPAMWMVKDADSKITLFGTVHLLPKDLDWRTRNFDQAFKSAEEVWFELDISPEGQQAAQAAAAQLGVSADRPLSSVLTPQDRARVRAAAEQLGVPDANLEPLRPWMAGLTLGIVQIVRAGFDPNSGVEKTLQAELGGRPTKAFETADQQIRFFADLPEDVQAQFLMSAVAEIEQGRDVLTGIVNAWSQGDPEEIEEAFLVELRRDYGALYEVLIKRRNEAWAARIAEEMAGSGTDFIAVGAAHLVGPDGVPALLRAKGFDVERVAGAE